MNENLKIRITNYRVAFEKFTLRLEATSINIQKVIDNYGQNDITIELVKNFYKMKIEEIELFNIIYEDIVNSKDFDSFRDILRDKLKEFKLKNQEIELQARADLAQLKKKKVKKIKSLSVKSMLRNAGLLLIFLLHNFKFLAN